MIHGIQVPYLKLTANLIEDNHTFIKSLIPFK